ncbi:MAG: HK97 family phage prohead protease [Bacteroidaceae bacterium]|nr:HK97 family phage prohead protease [Bacteroidaceae bacterium]
MKRIVISDESINSYGFWVMTDGIDLSAFLKNPVMLWNHNRGGLGVTSDQLPIGIWKDLRIENGVLTGEPVFDENDEFAVKIKQKYESGILNACSIGFAPLEWSDAPEMLKEGQKVATVTRCRLLEISICDIPSNANATVVLYDDDNKVINLSDLPNKAIGPKINNNMPKEIALTLGLDENASPQACVNAITELKSEIASHEATRQNLEEENRQMRLRLKVIDDAAAEAQKQEVVNLLDDAVKSGRIDATARPKFEKLFELDHEAAKTALAALPERKPMEAKPAGTGDSDLCKMSWDELDKADRLLELKTKYPEIYQQKFNEKFNKKH